MRMQHNSTALMAGKDKTTWEEILFCNKLFLHVAQHAHHSMLCCLQDWITKLTKH